MSEPSHSPSHEGDVPTTDHVYDGIREYDNPLPGWWTWSFIATVVFSAFYAVFYHSGTPGRSVHEQYEAQAAAIMELKFSEIGELTLDRPTLVRFMNDPKFLQIGRAVYQTNCVSCHGVNAEGNVGPNLTDDYWLHVRNIEDIATVIQNGAANGAMPAFRDRISHINNIVLAAAYVASLRGSEPAGGKSPQGRVIDAWPTEAAVSGDEQPEGEAVSTRPSNGNILGS
jgi:cytochrome c oxidase cbb3-type subunit III